MMEGHLFTSKITAKARQLRSEVRIDLKMEI